MSKSTMKIMGNQKMQGPGARVNCVNILLLQSRAKTWKKAFMRHKISFSNLTPLFQHRPQKKLPILE